RKVDPSLALDVSGGVGVNFRWNLVVDDEIARVDPVNQPNGVWGHAHRFAIGVAVLNQRTDATWMAGDDAVAGGAGGHRVLDLPGALGSGVSGPPTPLTVRGI